jgi:aspartate racemase
LGELKKRTRLLNKADPICLSIICNTAHILLPDLQKISKAPFVSMIDEVVHAVSGDNIKKIGILGTPMTVKSNLYQKSLKKFNIKYIEPRNNQLKILENIIRNVISNSFSEKNKEELMLISRDFRNRGAEAIILGCTELPLVFPDKCSLPIYNSVKILAMALLQKYYKQNTI